MQQPQSSSASTTESSPAAATTQSNASLSVFKSFLTKRNIPAPESTVPIAPSIFSIENFPWNEKTEFSSWDNYQQWRIDFIQKMKNHFPLIFS